MKRAKCGYPPTFAELLEGHGTINVESPLKFANDITALSLHEANCASNADKFGDIPSN
jgi:hypothetical protein